jgi:hypothetical protein
VGKHFIGNKESVSSILTAGSMSEQPQKRNWNEEFRQIQDQILEFQIFTPEIARTIILRLFQLEYDYFSSIPSMSEEARRFLEAHTAILDGDINPAAPLLGQLSTEAIDMSTRSAPEEIDRLINLSIKYQLLSSALSRLPKES